DVEESSDSEEEEEEYLALTVPAPAMRSWFRKIRVQPWIMVLVPTRFPSAISMLWVVSSVIGGILSIKARDMDTKLLSAPESNNTLAKCWFRRNVSVTIFRSWHDKLLTLVTDFFQWLAFYFYSSGQTTHLVASLTLDSAREEVEEDDRVQARFRDGKISSGIKKSQGSNIGDSDNTRDEGKIVGGAIGACGGISDSLLVALYACTTFIYGSS
nr:hypothetical protein [Tanacetum cinerariifolium]